MALKLLIGSRIRPAGWTTFDIAAGPEVDRVGDCRDLSGFTAGSFELLYASHVLEHVPLPHLDLTLSEWHRVVAPGGKAMIAVPDLTVLAQLYLTPGMKRADKVVVMRMMFGGQMDRTDFHHIGFDLDLLSFHLYKAGFRDIRKVASFGVFEDTSLATFNGVPISLNVEASKPRD